MPVTRFAGGVGIGGGSQAATKASAEHVLPASFNPTSSSQVLLGYLPPGAIVTDVVSWGGSTGGTNPTVDIGTSGDNDGFANELVSDGVSSAVAAGTSGALAGTTLSARTAVYGKVGASAATGGTTTVHVHYIVVDV